MTSRRAVQLAGLFVAIFCTTLAQPPVLGRLPIRYILKDTWNLNATDVALFFTLSAFPWYFKPLAALVSDRFKLAGSRRRAYIITSALCAGLLWYLLGVSALKYRTLLCTVTAINSVLMIGSAALGGYFVDVGRSNASTAIASTIVQTGRTTVGLSSGPLTGFLATLGFSVTCLTGGSILLVFCTLACWVIQDTSSELGSPDPSIAVWNWRAFLRLVFHPPMWITAGMLALIFLTPGFVTPLWYHQVDKLHFTPQFIGNLDLVGGLCGLAGGVFYSILSSRVTLRTVLCAAVFADVGTTVSYLWYDSAAAAWIVAALGGLVGVITLIALIELSARAAPIGFEALGYALLMTAWNMSMSFSDSLGSWLLDSYSMSFKDLVWLNAGASALVLPLVFALPQSLLLSSARTLQDEAGLEVT